MAALYYDTEADNLLPLVTKLHCIGCEDLDTGEQFYFGPPWRKSVLWQGAQGGDTLEEGIEFLQKADLIVAHNGLDYDRRMLKKLYPWYQPPEREWDSLILAKLIWPADSLIGPDMAGFHAGRFPGNLIKSHSLKAWGYRLGNLKDDYKGGFGEWSPEMASYMMQDVSAGVTLWKRCLMRLGWIEGVPTK